MIDDSEEAGVTSDNARHGGREERGSLQRTERQRIVYGECGEPMDELKHSSPETVMLNKVSSGSKGGEGD